MSRMKIFEAQRHPTRINHSQYDDLGGSRQKQQKEQVKMIDVEGITTYLWWGPQSVLAPVSLSMLNSITAVRVPSVWTVLHTSFPP